MAKRIVQVSVSPYQVLQKHIIVVHYKIINYFYTNKPVPDSGKGSLQWKKSNLLQKKNSQTSTFLYKF